MNKKIENAIFHIKCDYEAILDYIMTCLNNKLDYSSYMGVMPFFCMYVLEGYKYLDKNKLINADCIASKDLSKLKTYRSKGVKLYEEFKQTTFDSINEFNRSEYIKFYKKAFPKSNPRLLTLVDNYFICCVDEFPVGNYHLYSKKVFNMEIGSYIPDISRRIYDLAYLLSNFSSKIVVALDPSFDRNNIGARNIQMNFNYTDLNMAYDYSNFRIKGIPPILMAFLDILCVLNSYRKVFVAINDDCVFDLKVKYTILLYAIKSLISIIEYCEENKIDINMDKTMKLYIWDLKSIYIKNRLRRFCMHYDFPENTWNKDPFVEEFERFFEKPIAEISTEFSKIIEDLSKKLQDYLIVKSFA